jgi:hypothetical protein
MVKKKIWPSFQRIIELIPKNLSLSSKKYGFGIQDPGSEIWDPGSGMNLFRIPDPGPGVKKAPTPGSGSATLARTSVVDPDPHGPAVNER